MKMGATHLPCVVVCRGSFVRKTGQNKLDKNQDIIDEKGDKSKEVLNGVLSAKKSITGENSTVTKVKRIASKQSTWWTAS